MQRVTGLSDEQVHLYELQIEAVIRVQLQMVMDRIADHIASIQTASALVLVAAEQPPADSVPAGDGLPPGQPYVSPDDLAEIPPLWQEAVAQAVLPIAAEVFQAASGAVHAQMVDAVGHALPSVGSIAAEQYLAQARNTFDDIGNDLWETARNELLDGFERGESIPQLAERLRSSAGMTAKTATLVGRTKVIEASNAGSIATARASMLDMVKEWIATPDPRTRPTHLAADGQRVALNEKFYVGGYAADFPADPDLPPAEAYNCRCAVGYVIPDEQPDIIPGGPPGTTTIDRAIAEQGIAPPDGTTTVERALEAQTLPRLPGADVDLGELVEASTIVRPVLARAKTERDLQAAWRAEFNRIAGRDVLIQMPPNASLKTMSQYAEGTLQALERFPEAKIGEISWWSAPGKAYAQVTPGGRHGATLQFNAWWASNDNRAKLLRAMRGDTKGWDEGRSAWSVRNATSPTSTAYHEFAHVLDLENLGGRVGPQALAVVRRNAIREGIDEDALVSRDISTYAGSDVNEMIAEAFTDVMVNGPRASLVSREIYDLMVVEYRRGGFAIRSAPVDDLAEEAARAFPRLPASRLNSMTVAQLRALARERGVTVPTGVRKADLVRLLDEGDAATRERIARATAQSTIGETRRGPTQLEIALGEREAPSIFQANDFGDHDFRGPNGVILHRGQPLPEDFKSPRADIYQGKFATRPGLTAEESRALDLYVLSDVADPLNRSLRAGRALETVKQATLGDIDLDDIARQLDSAISGGSLATDTNLYRGAVMRPFDVGKLQPGAVFTEKGFLSTSTERGRAFSIINWRKGKPGFENRSPVLFKILAPRGTPAAVAHVAEREVLLGRGWNMRVIRVDRPARQGDTRIITVELVPGAAPRGALSGVLDSAADVSTAVVAKPVASATSKLTVTALRKLAKERGIDVPAGIRKADLVKLIDEAPQLTTGRKALSAGQLDLTGNRTVSEGLLSKAERDALNDYMSDAQEINAKLRRGSVPRLTRQLDQILDRSQVDRDVELWRGLSNSRATFGDQFDGDLTGFEWTDLGFQSTTANRRVAAQFSAIGEQNPVILRLVAPRGTHAATVSDWGTGDAIGGQAEVLLQRGLTMRVVRDGGLKSEPGFAGQVRLLDVEIVPSAAPQLTPAQIQRAAARARNAQIESSAGTARLLAEVDEIIAKGANRTALRQTLDDALIAPEQLFAGADPAVLDALKTALATGDMAKLKAAVTRLSTKAKIKVVGGKAGAKVKYDADTMEGVGGIDIPAGAQVTVVRRGSTVSMPDGEVVTLEKARVTPVVVKKSAAVIKAEASYVARQEKLRDLARHGTVVEHKDLSGGSIADTTLLVYDDGSRVVFKLSRVEPGRSADAEELSAMVLDAIEVRAPAVTRAANAVSMEYIDGRTGAELGMKSLADVPGEITDSKDGRLLGLADALLGNADRNTGNWMRLIGSSRLAAIDHGSAFRTIDIGDLRGSNPFVQYFFDDADPISRKVLASLPISRRQLARAKVRLLDLKTEFERLGRIDWYTGMIRRLEEIEKRASLA